MSAGLIGAAALEQRLRGDETAIVPYLTGGFPTLPAFQEALATVTSGSIAVEVGIPFSDPMAYGFDRLVPRLAGAGVAALVVPDLPLEESGELGSVAREHGIGLVQLVSPVTTEARLGDLGRASEGFTYAVTMTGTTGGSVGTGQDVTGYLDRVRAASRAPVVAGFGVRTAEQVRALAPHCDGVIVASALVEVLASGGDLVSFLQGLRQ
jgi:tryptophan synthase alpha chain